MATGVRQYRAEDEVDDFLLNQVSKWVLYHKLGSLARDLGIGHALFSRTAISHKSAQEQIFEVRILTGNIILLKKSC